MNGSKQTIHINGRVYDAVTGAPLPQYPVQPAQDVAAPPKAPQHHTAGHDVSHAAAQPHRQHRPHRPAVSADIHQKPQKSHTLHRAALKRPPQSSAPAIRPSNHQTPIISKFAPHRHPQAAPAPQPALLRRTAEPALAPPRPHPMVQRLLDNQRANAANLGRADASPAAAAPAQPATMVPAELKERLISQHLDPEQPAAEPAAAQRKNLFGQRPRLATVLTASLAMLILGGYLAYLNLPNISMRVAATRAGVAATLPEYKPDGYQFAGPITYAPGEVSATYKSAASGSAYTIKQKTSNWDSQAVLQNYVTKQSRVYLTYQEHGLTIYSFGNSAAWVNGGILYTIDGNAPLSSEQLLNIATSM